MADRWAVATGNWSNTATWNGGTLPTAADDVFADGFTVTIDQNVTVLSIRTTQRSGGTANGLFLGSGTVTINANFYNGPASHCLRLASGCVCTTVGSINPHASASSSYGVIYVATNTQLSLTGNVVGGAGGCQGIRIDDLSGNLYNYIVSVVGNVTGGASGAGMRLMGPNYYYSGNSGSITVIGNVSASNTYYGFYYDGTRANINPVVMTITGNIVSVGGISAFGHNRDCPLTIIHDGSITRPNNGNDAFYNEYYAFPPKILIHPTNTQSHTYRVNNNGSPGVARSLYTGGVNLNQPAVTNVRSGTVYGASNEFTGTCAVPPAGSVALGVPVDNTTGTGLINQTVLQAALEAALAPNAANIVERSTNDNKAITFSWPVSGATITGQKSIDNGAYTAVVGAITFLRTESNRHYYALAYNAADRNTVESSIRYKMTDGTYTKYFNLHVVPSGDVNVTLAPLAADQEPRNTRTRIIVYTGEAGTQYFFARDSQNNNLNLTGFNLELRFARGKSVIYTAKTTDGSLTISNGNQVNFARSNALTRGDGELTYALRDMGSGAEVLLEGPVTVRYAP